MRIGEELGLPPETLSSLFYALLLKDAGCSSNAARTCELFAADDFAVKRTWKTTDWASRWQSFTHVVRNVRPDGSLMDRARIWDEIVCRPPLTTGYGIPRSACRAHMPASVAWPCR